MYRSRSVGLGAAADRERLEGFHESPLAQQAIQSIFVRYLSWRRRATKSQAEIRDYCLEVWATAAVGLIHAYDPELIVIGGGVMRSADVILPYIQQFT